MFNYNERTGKLNSGRNQSNKPKRNINSNNRGPRDPFENNNSDFAHLTGGN